MRLGGLVISFGFFRGIEFKKNFHERETGERPRLSRRRKRKKKFLHSPVGKNRPQRLKKQGKKGLKSLIKKGKASP